MMKVMLMALVCGLSVFGAYGDVIFKPRPSFEDKILGADCIVEGYVSSMSFKFFDSFILRDILIVEYVIHAEKVLWPEQGHHEEIVVKCQMLTDSYSEFKSDIRSAGFFLLRKSTLFKNPRYEIFEPWGIGGELSQGDSYLPKDKREQIQELIKIRKELASKDTAGQECP